MSTLDPHAGHHDEGSYLGGPPGMIARIWQWASTIDHKKIGVMYLFAVLFMFFLGGMSAIAVRYELLDPIRTQTVEALNMATGEIETTTVVTGESLKELLGGITNDLTGSQVYNRAFTLHGAIMVFMFIIPAIPAALGNFFLPIMLGAKDVAFPRLNLMSWYIYVFGCTFGLSSILLGGVDTG